MSKPNARANELLRSRDTWRRRRQVWLAGLVIWGVVLGWVIFGFVNSLTDDMDVRLTWVLVWLLPVLVLAGGSGVAHRRVRACEQDLVDVERSQRA